MGLGLLLAVAAPAAADAPPNDPQPAQRPAPTNAPSAASVPEPDYPLDALSRVAPKGTDLGCPPAPATSYRGDVVRYGPAIWVNAAFRERLAAFERVVRDVGVEVYGRPPDRILQLGGYGCRRMRDHRDWLSEHAFGNAIDVEGFDFARLPGDYELPAGLDPELTKAFGVRVIRDWGKKTGRAQVHARFLRTLVQRLVARDVFRVLLGPGYPGHQSHFHFDMATFHLVQIFEDGELVLPP